MTKNNRFEIKQLANTDIETMRSLLNLFGEAFEEKKTYCQNQPENTYLEQLLARDYFITLVAFESDKVVGGLVAYELHKFEQKRSEIYIYDLAVDETVRRQGIATKLIKHLTEISRQRGAYVIFVQADYGDTPAIKLYESLGKKEEVLHFDIAPQ